ncbi:helix-turn-helix domain-containing protein [Microbulbifer sp. DLAB2-AF]|uniref:helix-turn-helix domain-containing protein n=1 Tax=Microbulbifer sp. DLAB2-AF TaxID=3243395 RepID=UPI00403A0D9F
MDDLFTGQNPMIGKNLKTIRSRLDVTQEKTAEMCGISLPTIARIEAGSECKAETVAKLANGLGCTTDALMRGVMEVPRDRKVEIMMRDIELLPDKRREQVIDTIEALITYYKYR